MGYARILNVARKPRRLFHYVGPSHPYNIYLHNNINMHQSLLLRVDRDVTVKIQERNCI